MNESDLLIEYPQVINQVLKDVQAGIIDIGQAIETLASKADELLALAESSNDNPLTEMAELFPGLEEGVGCPHCGEAKHRGALSTMIVALNDDHYWTREAIADWVESLDIDTIMVSEGLGD